VSLTVTDGSGAENPAATQASILDALAAQAYAPAGQTAIRLATPKPFNTVQIEPVDADFEVGDVDLSSDPDGFSRNGFRDGDWTGPRQDGRRLRSGPERRSRDRGHPSEAGLAAICSTGWHRANTTSRLSWRARSRPVLGSRHPLVCA